MAYAKNLMTQVFDKPWRADSLLVSRARNHVIMVSNAHWLLVLPEDMISQEFRGYFSDVPKGKAHKTGQLISAQDFDGFDYVLRSAEQNKKPVTITSWIYDNHFDAEEPMRVLTIKVEMGIQREIYVSLAYFNLILKLFGTVEIKGKDIRSAVSFHSGGDIVALLMPTYQDEKKWYPADLCLHDANEEGTTESSKE